MFMELRGSIDLAKYLLKLLNMDREHIVTCINGEIQKAYIKGVNQAEIIAKELYQQLDDLQVICEKT